MNAIPEVEGVDHRYVTARGLRFHVAEAGAGDDAILCLRGCGWSDAPRRGYEKKNMATDVLAVLDQPGLDRVKLVGHDWRFWYPADGSGAGDRLRPASPRRLRAARPGRRLGAQGRLGRGDPADLRRQPRRAGPSTAAVQTYRVFNWRGAWPIVRGRYAKSSLTVPTLLVFGVDDLVLRPQMLAGYEQHAEEMRVELVEDCGHFIADERPDLVAERARAFLG